MAPDDIRRDRAICDAATGGPWRADGCDVVQLTDSGNDYPPNYYPDSKDNHDAPDEGNATEQLEAIRKEAGLP